ncbi:D-sedoheptulose 7-phosphate isomerase [Gayadomonas joobiniege]|uniref:D-sedoheptulose 7-phosphate isomerase n=1 Tax=Gayadomonas joobiniege TaxID=1234606 RepID=UPI0003627DED|nr:D-sedoheptulose 7-phosphate isomerase [Gayadomonas joobiniege]
MQANSLSQSYADNLNSHIELFKTLQTHQDKLLKLVDVCHSAIKNGGKIVFCGNGGSAADSQHLAAEFVVRFKKDRKALAAIALTTDTSILTAHANDYGFDTVFARQVEALCCDKDVVIGLSTSGQSPNINLALQAANELGATSIAFTGRDGGKVKDIAQMSIIINHPETARIQEAHLFMGHWLCEAFDLIYAE